MHPVLAVVLGVTIAGALKQAIWIVGGYLIYATMADLINSKYEVVRSTILENLNLSSAHVQFVEVGAWFVETMQLGNTISALLTFVVIRFALSFLRR